MDSFIQQIFWGPPLPVRSWAQHLDTSANKVDVAASQLPCALVSGLLSPACSPAAEGGLLRTKTATTRAFCAFTHMSSAQTWLSHRSPHSCTFRRWKPGRLVLKCDCKPSTPSSGLLICHIDLPEVVFSLLWWGGYRESCVLITELSKSSLPQEVGREGLALPARCSLQSFPS